MRTWRDQYSKTLLELALGESGKFDPQHEIAPSEAQWADVWFEPDPALSQARLPLGRLGEMSQNDCMFESFSGTPSAADVRGCLRKLYTKQHARILSAQKSKSPEPPLPILWIVAPSLRPDYIPNFGLNASPGWPGGFYFSAPALGFAWISLKELPETRDTLMLRLMATDGKVLFRAVNEVAKLPPHAIEREIAKQILVAYLPEIEKNIFGDPNQLNEMKEAMLNAKEIYREWEREHFSRGFAEGELKGELKGKLEGKLEGELKGKLEGIQSSILEIYRARFGELPAAIEEAVRAQGDADRLMTLCKAFASGTPKEIAEALGISP